ncbi:MAG: ribbon-helix-helix domain-containing protein [Nitrospiraceae bacterium]|nr:ribbon-helix-helix domain-containing protein [Nitrospiraceae bacterium]
MGERRTYSVRLMPEIMKKLRFLAVESERPVSDLLEEAIEDLIKKNSPRKKIKKIGAGR